MAWKKNEYIFLYFIILKLNLSKTDFGKLITFKKVYNKCIDKLNVFYAIALIDSPSRFIVRVELTTTKTQSKPFV